MPPHAIFRAIVGIALFTAVIQHAAAAETPSDGAAAESRLLGHVRQLTFAGRRSGEGYFSADGSKLVFQSERHPGNPFYQIYLLDLMSGETRRLSPGIGKTTCAWVHPAGRKALFASTHLDPEAERKQKDELAFRASGRQRRYAWDYDPQYDLFEADLNTGELRRLTDAFGYDAEGSYSPDGRRIVFASNRHAHGADLSEEDAERFEIDPSYLMDLYIMDADGGGVHRLTDAPGYDGGPFFSFDGAKICWRRFSPDGATAEVFTMDDDGANERQVTRLGAMSWAPFFHPSGDYLIFTTNLHGFGNFELYIVDARGQNEPVRVTHTDGFDGLPAFHPHGDKLTWTSNRTPGGRSQIFLADWNDAEARRLLGLGGDAAAAPGSADAPSTPGSAAPGSAASGSAAAAFDLRRTSPEITDDDVSLHVHTLASERMAGRLTGTEGEKLATGYIAEVFRQLGLRPAGDDGDYFQPFEFTAGLSLGDGNLLALHRDGERVETYEVDERWRPMAFSATGRFEPRPIVFAGYGIVAPKSDEFPERDAYAHLDVRNKWVMVFRYLPEGVSAEHRQHLNRYASLRYKAMVARDKGAAGLIVVSGPNSKVRDQLVPLTFDVSLAGTSIPAVSITDEVAAAWLGHAGKDLRALQDRLDTGEPMMGFTLDGLNPAAQIDIEKHRRTGRNVLGRLRVADEPTDAVIVVGAHVDHLGRGPHSGSRAEDAAEDAIHYGADDNASGVAAMLEVAQWLADLKRRDELGAGRDVIFAAWSGEELGLLGSSHFVRRFVGDAANPDHLHAHNPTDQQARPVAAYINLDMVGRYREKLVIQGVGSSDAWPRLIERANVPVGLTVTTQDDAYLPTDTTPFYANGVPVLSAFTGVHEAYHTPRDTPEKLNYQGTERIARFIALLTRSLLRSDEAPAYIAQKPPEQGARRGGLRAYLGTIPDYAQTDAKGVKLSGVAEGGPADDAGLRGGDLVIELGGRKIENIYDYTYAIEALKIGQPVVIKVRRDGEVVAFEITPASRD